MALDGEVQISTAVQVLREAGIDVGVDGKEVTLSPTNGDPPEVIIWPPGCSVSRKTLTRLSRKYGIKMDRFYDCEREAVAGSAAATSQSKTKATKAAS